MGLATIISTNSKATAAASNALSSTHALTTIGWGNGTEFSFSGTLTLPSSYASIALITINAISPNGQTFQIGQYKNPSSTSLPWIGAYSSSMLMTNVAQSGWGLQFICVNAAGNPAAAPYSISGITVPALTILSVLGSEVGLITTQVGGGVQVELQAIVDCVYPGTISLWTKGSLSGVRFQGWFQVPAGTSTIVIGAPNSNTYFWAPTTANDSVMFVAVPGAVTWQVGDADPTTLTGEITSSAFTVYPASANSSMATNCYADAITYTPSTGGAYVWSISNMYATFPRYVVVGTYSPGTAYTVGEQVIYSGLAYVCLQNCTGQEPDTSPLYWGPGQPNPNFFYGRLYMVQGSGTGASFSQSTNSVQAAISDDGNASQVGPNTCDVHDILNWGVPSDNNTTFRFYWKVAARSGTNTSSGFSATEVQQDSCWSGGVGTSYTDGSGNQWYDVVVNSANAKVVGSQITGSIPASNIVSVNASVINGNVNASQIGSVNASVINGNINASQIGSVNASVISGSINASVIGYVAASGIVGAITASVIGVINASQITGTIAASQIGSVSASTISVGLLAASQIGSVAASSISVGVLVSSQLAASIINSVSLLSGNILGPSLSISGNTINSTTVGPNLMTDPSFENGGVGWNISAGWTTSTSSPYVGATCMVFPLDTSNQGTPINQFVPIVPGKQYQLTAWAKADSGVTGPGQLEVFYRFYENDQITPVGYGAGTTALTLTTSWQQYPVFITPAAPAGSSYLLFYVYGACTNSSPSNIYLDACSVQSVVDQSLVVSVQASTINGFIIANQIQSVNASTINGTVVASQIGSIQASVITGNIDASNISAINASVINGSLTINQLGYTPQNLISDGGFENGVGPWTLTGCSITSSKSYEGAYSLAMPSPYTFPGGNPPFSVSAGQPINLIAGQQYLVSCYVLCDPGVSMGIGFMQFFWEPVGNPAGSAAWYLESYPSTSWQYVSQLITAPASGPAIALFVPDTTTGTGNIYIDACTIQSAVTGQQIVNLTINASQISGTISASNIGTINASEISGSINASNIGGVYASLISGSINASNLTSIQASAITGYIASSNINSINASYINGSIFASNITSLTTSVISGSISVGGGMIFSSDVNLGRGSGNPSISITSSSGILLYSKDTNTSYPYANLTPTSLTLYNGAYSVQVTGSQISLSTGGSAGNPSLTLSGSSAIWGNNASGSNNAYVTIGPSAITLTGGSNTAALSSSGLTVTAGSSSTVVSATGVKHTANSGSTVDIGTYSGYADSTVFTYGGSSTVITGNSVSCGSLTTVTFSFTSIATSTSLGGSRSTMVGSLPITITGTTYYIPIYA